MGPPFPPQRQFVQCQGQTPLPLKNMLFLLMKKCFLLTYFLIGDPFFLYFIL